ncbi:Hmcn1 [Symbiodinium natans]|uniref:Hmcn1 protein n=1 Tax=Symbiodinium natans TaxID=878477 RepID=A0A812NW57_9DINO|nr:Hmcn1 [Symbiodinium natans]
MMVFCNKRLWLGILLSSKLVFHLAIASTVRSHSKGDTESREDAALTDEDGAAAVSRRIMRAEKIQEDSIEVPAAGLENTVPFGDVLFNVTVQPPPVAEPAEQNEHASEQQDCRWYDWSPWSYCSKSCGQGWKSRKRTVALQPRHGGLECDGASEDFDRCNEIDCPVDCHWDVWSDWSHCTASCDGGTRQRGKPIKVQNNSLGKPCNMAEGIQVEDCGTTLCPRDCKWADWSAWGDCSTTCAGGVKLRTRSIAEAAVSEGKKCEGATQDEEVCNVKACPTDCVLADWSNWKACSVTCGNGTSTRMRKVLVKEDGGGRPCSEPLEQEKPCAEKTCPVDCLWGDWSHWSHCSQTCGSNVSLWATSARKRLVEETAGGRPCDGEDEQKKLCGQKPCPIDCVWADWNEWKACTKSCGAGITDRLRNISIPAAHEGKECFGSTRDVKTCNEELCPQDCSFADWEDWSECSRPCGDGSAIRYRIIDTPAARGGQACLGPKHETGSCNGTDCVTTEELIRKGYASQITGAMHIITEDPVSYAANPLVEQVSREALAEFAELPVRRVHVSLMPDSKKGSRDVINWFSMLVPNSTNLTAVLDYISKKDLAHAGRILRSKLRRVGVLILVNISKLYVNSHGRKETDSTELTKTKTTTGAPSPAWNNPNATRLTGVVKMIVPEPLKFAEDLKTKEATEQLLAELSGIAKPGVRASLIPDQVYRYEAEFGDDTADVSDQAAKRNIPSDSIQNKSGEVHAWFSMVGAVQPNRLTATEEARKIAQAMMAEDLKAVTIRNNIILETVGLIDAKTKVIQILAKADGDQEQVETVLDQDPAQVRVTGVIEMVTDYPKSFSADRRSEEGLLQALSQLVGMPTSSIRVSLVPSETRVESLLQQPVEGEEVPPDNPVDDKDSFGNEVSAWFVITVSSQGPKTPDEVAEKLQDQDLTLAGLKIQNCLMDEGMDLSVKVGRITAMVQTTTTTTLATGVIKKVDFHGDAGSAGAAVNKTSAAAAAAKAAPGSSVVGDASAPAKVVAVVAAVSPNDVEPPTMSNPGGGDEESDDEEQSTNATHGSLLQTGAKSASQGNAHWMWLPILLCFA